MVQMLERGTQQSGGSQGRPGEKQVPGRCKGGTSLVVPSLEALQTGVKGKEWPDL